MCKKWCLAILIAVSTIILSLMVSASQVTTTVNRLNYYGSETHAFTVTNPDSANGVQVNYTIPSGWSAGTGTATCGAVGSTIVCNVSASGTGQFSLTSPAADTKYKTTTITASPLNGSFTSANNVTLLNIPCGEVFYTLVEFGRGRGNYLYESGSGRSGSGKSRGGCTSLPNGTMFQLNYLHKIQNIQQYLGLANAEGQNATFSCNYETNTSVVRKHLISSITRGLDWNINYSLPEITSSWERMGYVGMNMNNLVAGATINSSCSGMNYSLPSAYGNVLCDGADTVNFTIVNRDPFSVSGQSVGGILGNGTAEIVIEYNVTNTGADYLDNVIIEIEAPQNSLFIGTRGELWGAARDQFRIEKIEMAGGQSEIIQLVARFNTSLLSASVTSLNLTKGVKVSSVPCWEANAYNPGEYVQTIPTSAVGGPGGAGLGNVTVNMGLNTTVINLITVINNIYNITFNINATLTAINSTIEDIYNLSWQINQSTYNLSYNVWNYDTRTLTFYSGTGGSGTGGVACTWNTSSHYNTSNGLSSNYSLVYGTNIKRVDFDNIYSGTTDAWKICHRSAPSSATAAGNDLLEIYLCNDYDGSGDPHTEAGCTLLAAEDIGAGGWVADHFSWKCESPIRQEVTGQNVSIIYKCDACTDTTDAWQISVDTTTLNQNYTMNSTDTGTTWVNATYESLTDWEWCVPIDYGYEVWSYQNRTLTDWNFTVLLNMFNCTNSTGGYDPSSNMMCNLLSAINLTTTNMQAAISAMNTTINNIYNGVVGVNNTVNGINNAVYDMNITLVEVQTAISGMNTTVNNIYNAVNGMNDTINNINASLYVMNQTMVNEFNALNISIETLLNFSANIELILNCSNPEGISPNITNICYRINNLQQNLSNMQTNITDILNLVMFINGTRWGNYSSIDIINAINNVSSDSTNVLNELYRMREFEEELVFLVTDSIVLQRDARVAVNQGDLPAAAMKLTEANVKLKEATNRLSEIRVENPQEAVTSIPDKISVGWWIPTLLIILIVVLGMYLFSRPKEPYQGYPPDQYQYPPKH